MVSVFVFGSVGVGFSHFPLVRDINFSRYDLRSKRLKSIETFIECKKKKSTVVLRANHILGGRSPDFNREGANFGIAIQLSDYEVQKSAYVKLDKYLRDIYSKVFVDEIKILNGKNYLIESFEDKKSELSHFLSLIEKKFLTDFQEDFIPIQNKNKTFDLVVTDKPSVTLPLKDQPKKSLAEFNEDKLPKKSKKLNWPLVLALLLSIGSILFSCFLGFHIKNLKQALKSTNDQVIKLSSKRELPQKTKSSYLRIDVENSHNKYYLKKSKVLSDSEFTSKEFESDILFIESLCKYLLSKSSDINENYSGVIEMRDALLSYNNDDLLKLKNQFKTQRLLSGKDLLHTISNDFLLYQQEN